VESSDDWQRRVLDKSLIDPPHRMERTERGVGPGKLPIAKWIGPVILSAVPWAWFAIRDVAPAMDAVTFALPLGSAILAIATLSLAIILSRMRIALVSLSLAVFTVVVVVAPRLAQPSPRPIAPFRLVSANTFLGNEWTLPAARTLAGEQPDVLVAVETSEPMRVALRLSIPADHWAGLGNQIVFARWPVSEPLPIPGVSQATGMRVEVARPGLPFVVYAVHLPNPLYETSFSAQAATIERLLQSAQGEHLPVILAGDFNMTDRSTSYRALDGAMRDAMRSSFAATTYDRWQWALLQLRIDYVFVSDQLCDMDGSTFTVPGSDHDALEVDLGACPS
jgi:endonuclease/exonuclease/phosphatase (EEP) superfamily protein YafD